MDNREIDQAVLVKVLGYEAVTVKPDWYSIEVTLFRKPGASLFEYSYDARTCNAMMYRNGVDDKDGIAQPIPFFTEELDHAWEIVEWLQDEGRNMVEVVAMKYVGEPHWVCRIYRPDTSFTGDGGTTAAEAICRAALRYCGAVVERMSAAPVLERGGDG